MMHHKVNVDESNRGDNWRSEDLGAFQTYTAGRDQALWLHLLLDERLYRVAPFDVIMIYCLEQQRAE